MWCPSRHYATSYRGRHDEGAGVKGQAQLFPSEEFDWEQAAGLFAAGSTDEEIDAKYLAGDVRIVTEQGRYPMNTVPALVRSGNYNLNPDFQRRHRWSREKQSRLIESFIMNVPVPPVFLYENEYSNYEVMDGLQRLTAIAEFYEDRFALEGLDQWPELNGRTYRELPEQIRRGIDRRYLSSVVLLYETAKDEAEAERLKQLVFERINSGGEDLSHHESRNALYPGPMNRLCVRLARNAFLCRMWGIPEPGPDENLENPDWELPRPLAENPMFQKMEDAELVLRFFAHRQRRRLWTSGTRLHEYHTRYLRSANAYPADLIEELAVLFKSTTELVWSVLGEKAFWLYRERAGSLEWVARPTLVAYDPIMFAFSRLLDHGDQLKARAVEVQNAMEGFYAENYALFDGRKTNATDIEQRDEVTGSFFEKFVL